MREDAAVTFMAAGDLEAALQQYQEGNIWRMAMFIAGKDPSSIIDYLPEPCHCCIERQDCRYLRRPAMQYICLH